MDTGFQPECIARHSGIYHILPRYIMNAWQLIQGHEYPLKMNAVEPMTVAGSGIAVLSIRGMMLKGESKFGDTVNTIQIRREVQSAARNDSVKAMLMMIDSPGGQVAGTGDLVDDLRAFGKQKPLWAYVEDLGASAAYRAASAAQKIFANRDAEIGSIGTVAVVEDTSKLAESQGVRVHVVSTGAMKGAFSPGTEISQDMIDELQTSVNDINLNFLADVTRGRGLRGVQLEAVSDGNLWIAEKALDKKLIDGIQSLQETVAQLGAQVRKQKQLDNKIRITRQSLS